jgi:hypothetical protein
MPLLETDNEKLKVGQFRQKQAFKEKEDWSAFRGGLLHNFKAHYKFKNNLILFKDQCLVSSVSHILWYV